VSLRHRFGHLVEPAPRRRSAPVPWRWRLGVALFLLLCVWVAIEAARGAAQLAVGA
jgi:uncharacterized membrane protein